MVVAVMRGIAPEECMDLALSPTRDCKTPMAPALGLFLVSLPLPLPLASVLSTCCWRFLNAPKHTPCQECSMA